MFIDVTRYGGLRLLRVSVRAIAYLDEVDGGAAVHLIGGETLRVNEDPAELELRCMIATEEAAPAADTAAIIAPDASPAPPPLPPTRDRLPKRGTTK